MSPFKKLAVKGSNNKRKELVIDLTSFSLSQRKLDLQLEFSMTLDSDPIPHFKRIQATSKVSPGN